jgi:hypothetical protein
MDSTSPTPAARPCFAVRLCAELKRLAILVILCGLAIIAGKYYGFDRLDEEIRARVESRLREHYIGLVVMCVHHASPGREIRGIRIAGGRRQGCPVLVEIDGLLTVTRRLTFTKPPRVTLCTCIGCRGPSERPPV